MEVINTSGRRKCSVARAYVSKGTGIILINKRDYKEYFKTPTLQYYVLQSLNNAKSVGLYDVKVNVNGGGTTGQAQAVRLAIAKAICNITPENRQILNQNLLLRRDSRIKERRKYGLKKARKASQYSKR